MQVNEFKLKVKEILETEIKFDGYVNLVVKNLSERKQQIILDWIKRCKQGVEIPEPCKQFKLLMAFIYKSNDNKIRGILTKEKNKYFIELFLDKHKYYDEKRRYLGI
ncbi:hypothetical protein HOK51_02535 [Candidatus Woesearchaeota archaeon]|nr:hypothetical protein [Candidatus Woesearchaeota archaeon]MBT6518695.1 hypothetical protein [Candidatus Woesearchaeota archaeon]MBT7368383.1 hypothetical protein [Candidatus Woesearchaeota archaeon]